VDVRGVSSRLRVLIAEYQYLTREGTRRLLEERDELEVVGVASDLGSVLERARRLRPDVIVMDIKMPPGYSMEGIEAAHAIKEERPETGVVIRCASSQSRRDTDSGARHRTPAWKSRASGRSPRQRHCRWQGQGPAGTSF